MSPRAERFCAEYMVDMNATQAAIRAGYSRATARSIGHENLTKPDIQERISALRRSREHRTQLNADSVVQELAKIAFTNISDFIRWSGDGVELLPLQLIERTKMGAIESIAVADSGGHKGFKVKLKDSLRALELLGRHLGIFDGHPKNPAMAKEDVARRLSEALDRAQQRLMTKAARSPQAKGLPPSLLA